MTVDIEKLKALALAATPGPWIHDAEDNIIYPADGGRMIDICCRSTDLGTEQRDNNAAFIARCNPAAVLDLIAEVERLTVENANLQYAFSMAKDAAPAAGTVNDAERLDWLEARQATLTRLYDNSGYILAIDGRAIKTAITARRAIDAAIESHTKAGSAA